jgi:hypothetical protein
MPEKLYGLAMPVVLSVAVAVTDSILLLSVADPLK